MPGEQTASISMAAGLALVAALVFGFSAVSRKLGRWNLSAPIVFVGLGWALSAALDYTQTPSEPLKILAEATLAIVLFSDAAGVRPREIGREGGLVGRLLLIGLPLTIAAGALLAALAFNGIPWYFALLLAAMLAPTDAALGAATVLNKAVPTRIRRVLNVESGLNDGLATPVVLFAIAALAGEEGLTARTSLTSAVVEIGLGAAVGAFLGYLGGLVIRTSVADHLSSAQGRTVAVLMLPVLAYTAAILLEGNGFIAAFLAGTFYAAAVGKQQTADLELTETLVEPMSYATWLAFGALVVPALLVGLGWGEVLFALASLTILRMVPVAISLLGSGLTLRSVAFIGWFGPRGLASVVFSLIAVETLEPSAALSDVLATATLTILLSVILHGLSAGPGARRYGNWVAETNPPAETRDAPEPRGRGVLAQGNP